MTHLAKLERDRLLRDRKVLLEALKDAACSLETIRQQAGIDDFLMDMYQIRGYANSRANAARVAIKTAEES